MTLPGPPLGDPLAAALAGGGGPGGGLPPLPPEAEDVGIGGGPDMVAKMDEMMSMMQAILTMLEGPGSPGPPPLDAGAPVGTPF